MSWYDESWAYRAPVIVEEGVGTTAAQDVTIALPFVWPQFWDSVDSAGADIRIATANGVTLATYQLQGWDYANRTGTIEVDGVTPPAADSFYVLWLYWGNSGASSAAGSFTAASAQIGRIHVGDLHSPIVSGAPAGVGATAPPSTIAKTSDENIFVWVDCGILLEKLAEEHEGHLDYEEVSYVKVQMLNAGTDETAEHDDTKIRMTPDSYVRVQNQTSSADVDRTLSLSVITTEDRVLNPRALIQVRDPDET